MPTLLDMEEDFPRGGNFMSGGGGGTDTNGDDDDDRRKKIDNHSVKTKKRKNKNKLKNLITSGGKQGSTNQQDDLLIEDKDSDDEDNAKGSGRSGGKGKGSDNDEEPDNDFLNAGSDNLFKITKPSKKIRDKKKAEKVDSDDDDDEEFVVEPLTYDNVVTGLLSLGIVCEIKDHEVLVSLPGRIVGSIPLKSVSKPYTKLLAKVEAGEGIEDISSVKPLSSMFSIGQVVIVKVMHTQETETGKIRIALSTDPAQINSNYNATLIAERMVFMAAVQSIEDHGVIMDLGIRGVRAFLPKNRIASHKLNDLGIGQLLKCKVVKSEIQRLICTLTLSANFSPTPVEEDSLNSALLLPGMQVEANIMQTHKTGLKVYFMELMGTIYQDHTSHPWHLPAEMEKYSSIAATILYIHPTTGSLPALIMRQDLIPQKNLKAGFYSKGRSYSVVVQRFEKRGVIVKFQNGQKGIVSTRRCFLKKDPTTEAAVTSSFPQGSTQLCRVLEFSGIDDIYIGSFAMAHSAEHRSIEELKAGTIVRCTLVEWKKSGALVSFDGLLAFIPNTHFDKFSPLFTRSKHPENSKLKVMVLKVSVAEGKILLTARKKLIKSDYPIFSSVHEIKCGAVTIGTIFRTSYSGIQVLTVGGLLGFIPASLLNVPKNYIVKQYALGEIVIVKVIEVEPKRPTLIFSLDLDQEIKAKTTSQKDSIMKIRQQPNHDEIAETSAKSKKKKDKNKKLLVGDNADQKPTIVVKEEEEEMKAQTVRPLKRKIIAELRPEGSSFWSNDEVKIKEEENDSSNDEGENEAGSLPQKSKKSKKTSKDSAEMKREAEIREKENALADPTRIPESVDDYELLVMASPNSSMCWIKYISFHLEAGNLDEARRIGQRALSTITFNEEQERFNVWTALLNLENDYGTADTLKNMFTNAHRNCDALEIYKKLAQIYINSKKNNEAEKVLKIMVKKFPDCEAVWSMAAVFFYRIKNLEEGRTLCKRAIERLDKRHHVELISKFAQLELNFGDFEQGRALYEKLVGTYPSRCDLWLVYVNQLIKQKDFDGVRNLFDRILHVGINPKKIHPILKRFLEFEREHGTPESIAQVESTCSEYVTTRLGFGVDQAIAV